MESQALPRSLLVIGSSVCTGAGASRPDQAGWHARLFHVANACGIRCENKGIGGTHVAYWQPEVASWRSKSSVNGSPLSKYGAVSPLSKYGVVIMALSLGNEGLGATRNASANREIEMRYIEGLRAIALGLRECMLPEAHLVLGGPYPNSRYDQEDLATLERVREASLSWPEVNHVIDFLHPAVHDGSGDWHKGASADPGHPNDRGHQQMFQCLDLPAVLGPLAEDQDLSGLAQEAAADLPSDPSRCRQS